MMKRVEEIIEHLMQAPHGFIIGTASSAHQIEGNNSNDWTEFEKKPGNIKNNEVSGRAANHYELYETDFQLLEDLGFQAHRLSIEWSRIYPAEGVIDNKELDHYKRVLTSLKEHGQQAFVTLHHFTTPKWFINLGGFAKRSNLVHWNHYVRTVCSELSHLIDVICTLNEPAIYASAGYLAGIHSPGKKSLRLYFKVTRNMYRAHFNAVSIAKELCPQVSIGLVKSFINFTPKNSYNPIDLALSSISDWAHNRAHLKSLEKGKLPFSLGISTYGDIGDFIGVNYYMRNYVGIGSSPLIAPFKKGERLTMMDWGVAPEFLHTELTKIWNSIQIPIYITENGIATDDDKWRQEFILRHLEVIGHSIEEGIDIRGYFYWSNLDNFEWNLGYYPTFGLIAFDTETFERMPKPSANLLGKIARRLSASSS